MNETYMTIFGLALSLAVYAIGLFIIISSYVSKKIESIRNDQSKNERRIRLEWQNDVDGVKEFVDGRFVKREEFTKVREGIAEIKVEIKGLYKIIERHFSGNGSNIGDTRT